MAPFLWFAFSDIRWEQRRSVLAREGIRLQAASYKDLLSKERV